MDALIYLASSAASAAIALLAFWLPWRRPVKLLADTRQALTAGACVHCDAALEVGDWHECDDAGVDVDVHA